MNGSAFELTEEGEDDWRRMDREEELEAEKALQQEAKVKTKKKKASKEVEGGGEKQKKKIVKKRAESKTRS